MPEALLDNMTNDELKKWLERAAKSNAEHESQPKKTKEEKEMEEACEMGSGLNLKVRDLNFLNDICDKSSAKS